MTKSLKQRLADIQDVPTQKELTDQSAKTLQQVADEYVLEVYRKNGFNKAATARELKVSVRTVYNRLKRIEGRDRA